MADVFDEFRLATADDFDATWQLYADVCAQAPNDAYGPKWTLNVYPAKGDISGHIEAGEMYLGLMGGVPVAAMVLVPHEDPEYAAIDWPSGAKEDEVSAIHLLTVHPSIRGRHGGAGWATAGEIEYERGEEALGNVVFLHELDERGADLYRGAFVTDLPVLKAWRAVELADWGRRRWNIENGFHTLKGRDGFGLEHSFCNDETAGANMHALMTIAHTLWQLLDSGYLRRIGRAFRKVRQVHWAELVREALRLGTLDAADLDAAVGARRMRFQLE